jgi:hypothetical protein
MYNKINVKRHLEERICLNCGKKWSIYVKKDAQTSRKNLFCEECTNNLTNWEKQKIKMQKVEGYREVYLKQKREEFLKSYIRHLFLRTKKRALKNNLEFNLDISDINIPETCPILEVPLVIGTKEDYEYSPSIDRIDNEKGYIKGNIQIISKKANSMKNSATLEELHKFCKNILRYSLNTNEKEVSELEDKEPLG